MPDRIEIAPLAAHPEWILTLAGWFEDSWPSWYGPGGPGNAVHDLEARCRHSGLPFALVAHCGGELGGIAALLKRHWTATESTDDGLTICMKPL